MEKEIRFVARHYRKGLFVADTALRRMGFGRLSIWTPARIAAAAVAFVVLSATATLVIHNVYTAAEKPSTVAPHQTEAPAVAEVKVIDFENAPLTAVVAKIKEVYGVEVYNLPENADEFTLSLHYEGTAADLVETINDILGTDIEIRKE